jgi:CysZ protein
MGHAFSAFGFVLRTPQTWPLCLVPAVLFTLLATLATAVGVTWLTPWVQSLLPTLEGGWETALTWAARVLTFALSLLLGAWSALLLTPPLSGPALERLVQVQERALFVPERPLSSFWRELVIGLQAQLLAVCFAVPVMAVLWVIGFVFPPAAIVTTPLTALVTAMALAWNLFDYPLTLRGVTASERLGFVANHASALVGFALAFTVLLWVPCLGLLMLPVGVVGATRLLYGLLEAYPDELPALARPVSPALPEPSSLRNEIRPGSQSSNHTPEISRRG